MFLFNLHCDICGKSKFKNQSGLTRHRDACQEKRRRDASKQCEQSAYSPRQSFTGKEYAATNAESEIFENISRDASHEPMPQSLTGEGFTTGTTELRQFAELFEDTVENPSRDVSPEPMLLQPEAAAGSGEPSVTGSRHTVAKTVSYTQATKRQAGTKLTLEEAEREMPLIDRKGL
jgi:hypothetical protein